MIDNIVQEEECYCKQSLYSRTKIHTFVDDYVVLDLETTGFSPANNEIIEISALKYNNNTLIGTFSQLIKPSCSIPNKITKLTGITNEDLQGCPDIINVLPNFLNFIENYTLVTYNGSFDLGFIERFIERLKLSEINNSNLDVLYLARNCIGEVPNYKLETLKEHFELNFESHRALSDCYTTNYIYQYCKTHQGTNSPHLNSVHHKTVTTRKNFFSPYHESISDSIIDTYKNIFTNNSFLKNKNIVITGEMNNFNRNELIALLNLSNVNIVSSVSKKTDILILGNNDTMTTKFKRALELIQKR